MDTAAVFPVEKGVIEADDEQALVESGADIFVLDGQNPVSALSAVKRIRATPRTSLAPVFSTSAQGSLFFALADGCIREDEDFMPAARNILAATRELNLSAILENEDLRLLAWLYTRRNGELLPVADPFEPGIYSYPIAECFTSGETNVLHWIRGLQARGQLVAARLIDRIRLCPSCGGAHLNFMDVCPSCSSFDISKKERHSDGVDAPTTAFACSDCGEHFSEPGLIATCYECGSQNTRHRLGMRAFYTWKLTEKGRISVRAGEMDSSYSLFDQFGNVTPSYFEQILNWNLSLTRRYPDETFTLLALHPDNMDQVAAALGKERTTQLIDVLVPRLKELLRATDLTARFSPEMLCLLLPRTSAESGEVVRKRILALDTDCASSEAPILRMRVERFSFPEDLIEGEDSEGMDIISRLNARLRGE